MAKVFNVTVKKRRVVQQGGGGSTGEVDRERLQYDNRNTNRRAIEQTPRVSIVSQEMNQRAEDTVTAAVLGQANEINERAVETSISMVTGTANEPNRKAAVEMPMIAGSVSEMNRKASDATTATVVPTADVAKRAVEDISNTVTATAGEVGRRQADLIETVIIPLTDVNRKASAQTDSITINFGRFGDGPANGSANSVISNTNFSNPNNAIDGSASTTFASLTATASGIGGLTSVTTNGQLTLGFPDPTFPDIPLSGATVQLRFGLFHATAGTLPLGQSWSSRLQVSVDNGANFAEYILHTGSGAKDSIFDITAQVGGDYAKLAALQARIVATVVSGTGLGASARCDWYSCIVAFSVSKTY